MKAVKYLMLYSIGLAIFIIPACNKEDDTSGFVSIILEEKVGTDNLEFDNIMYPAQAGHTFSVSRVKYYISNIVLKEENGREESIDMVHYRDSREADTQGFSLGEIPQGKYVSISFVFGLDETLNVDNGLENTIDNINMEWPIPGDQGYHYMKFEGKYDSLGTGVIKNFNLHTGATQGNQNYVSATLAIPDMLVNNNSWEIRLMMDLNEWLQNPNIYDFAEFGQAIMMNQNAQEVLKANGATVFSVTSVTEK